MVLCNAMINKKQTCSRTHVPVRRPSAMSLAALGPWPWPMEMMDILVEYPFSSANFSRAAVGSDPEESTKRRGTVQLASLKLPGRSNSGGS